MKIEQVLKVQRIESKKISGGGGAEWCSHVYASGSEHHVELSFSLSSSTSRITPATSEFARALAAEGIHRSLRVTIEIESDSDSASEP